MKQVDKVSLLGELYKNDFDFWNKFVNDFTRFELNQRLSIKSGLNNYYEKSCWRVDSSPAQNLLARVKNNDTGILNFFISIMAILCNKYSGENRIIIDTPLLALGDASEYSKRVPMFFEIKEEDSLRTFFNKNQQTLKDSYKFQGYPLELIGNNDNNQLYLTNVLLRYDQLHEKIDLTNVQYHLVVNINRIDHDFFIEIHYKNDLFEDTFIHKLKEHFSFFINNIGNLDLLIKNFSLLNNEERKLIVEKFNETKHAFPDKTTVAALFEDQVKLSDNKLAIIFKDQYLTYDELNQQANKLAHHLRGHFKIKADDLVAVMLDRSPQMIISILGILKAGGAYLPVDPKYPIERKEYILGNASIALLITESNFMFDIPAYSDNLFAIDIELDQLEKLTENPTPINKPVDLAYVIYTSGSTGNPKGVMIEHRSLINTITDQIGQYGVTTEDRILQFASASFDASVCEIFIALHSGSSLVLLDEPIINSSSLFVNYLEYNKVSVVILPPSYLNVLKLNTLKFLRVIITAGEPAQIKDALFCSNFLDYYNAYGPTECTVCVSTYKVSQSDAESGSILIGKPISNTRLYVLDENLTPVPIGIKGRIYVAGIGVARGYLNNEVLTKEKFLSVSGEIEEEKLYDTGDYGRWTSDGNLEYIGRIDQQIKIRGYRVELGEIESILRRLPGIDEAVVIAKKEQNEYKYIIAYYTSQACMESAELEAHLKIHLPHFMMPARIIKIKDFTLTSNGKIDRKILEIFDDQVDSGIYKAAGNDFEEQIISIWKEVLKVDRIGVDDNYFVLGGDSLKAIQIIVKIEKQLNKTVTIADIYNYATVKLLSNFIFENKATFSLAEQLSLGYSILQEFQDKILNDPEDRAKLPLNYEDIYPIAPIEEGMIYTSLLNPDEPIYYDQFTFQVEIADIERFKSAFALMVDKHSIFRTQYYIGRFKKPIKVILKDLDLLWEFKDLSNWNRIDQKEEIVSIISQDLQIRLSFDGDILWRLKILDLGDNKYFILWSVYHAILDGWSENAFIAELSRLINNDEIINPLKSSYKDYTALVFARQISDKTISFWKDTLSGYSRNKLPFNWSGKRKLNAHNMAKVAIILNDDIISKLESVAATHNFSLKTLFISAKIYLFHLINNEDDIVTGVVTHDRPAIEDGDKILGCFLNTIPIRIKISGTEHLLSLATKVEKYLLNAKDNEIHLTEISKIIGEKVSSGNPIFDCIINYVDFHILDDFVEGTGIVHNNSILGNDASLIGSGTTNTLFDLEVGKTMGAFGIAIKYSSSYFDGDEMRYALELYERILDHFTGDLYLSLNSLDLMTEGERKVILQDFNDTKTPYNHTGSLHGIFENQVLQTPEHVALRQDGFTLSYAEVNKRANRVAWYLKSQGIIEGEAIGICSKRNFSMIIGMYGILKSGCSYVPVDPGYPDDRQRYIIRNSGLQYILTDDPSKQSEEQRYIYMDDLLLADYSEENPNLTLSGESLAYTIYTSGSTGRPKGVMIQHHAAVNLIEWVNSTFGINESDRLLFITSMCFDLSVYDIFGMLSSGGSLVIAREEEVQDIQCLKRLLEEESITFWDSVPTTMHYLVSELSATFSDWQSASLRLVFLSGDWIPVSLPEKIRTCFPGSEVISLGGATECTVWSNYYRISDLDRDWRSIPYGKPINNNSFYILNEKGLPVLPGVVGELYIGGVGVAQGYAGEPEKSRFSFVSDPFISHFGGVMYRTGDLGRMRSDGNMEFIGRKDTQVKIRGYRVELGEIEHQLESHESVSSAVVEAIESEGGHKYLCAYIISDGAVPEKALQAHLSGLLPSYMLPAHYVYLDSLPLTSNGKIDRKGLPAPETGFSAQNVYIAPVSKTEKKLAGIWEELLGIKQIGLTDNILELGAHSLVIGAFVNRLHREQDVVLTLRDVFMEPTIGGLAAIMSKKATQKYYQIEKIESSSNYELSHAQRRLWISWQLTPAQTAYNLPASYRFKGRLDIASFRRSFHALLERHEILRTRIVQEQGDARQEVLSVEDSGFDLIYEDLRGHADLEALTLSRAQAESRTVFRLDQGTLFRARLLQTAAEEYLFILTMHHIISDGWSMEILFNEILQLYSAFLSGKSNPLEPLTIQYKDYAHWQNRILSGESLELHRNYWLNELSGALPELNLPTDHSRPLQRSDAGGRHVFLIGVSELSSVREQCIRSETSLFVFLQAVVKVLLYKYTGQEDIIVGTTVAGRDHSDLENQIGFYVNLIALRSRIDKKGTFDEFLRSVNESTLSSYGHQSYPFNDLVDNLKFHRDNSRTPVFEVLVELLNIERSSSSELEGISVEGYDLETGVTQYDLSFRFKESEGELYVILEYSRDLFERSTIEELGSRLVHLLNVVVSEPHIVISKISLTPAVVQQEIRERFNPTSHLLGSYRGIHSMIEEQARLYPDRVALYYGEKEISYAELDSKSNQLAHHLRRTYGFGSGDRGGILLDRSERMVIGLLGILKAGGCYVPIDPGYPADRRAYILSDSGVMVLLTDMEYLHSQEGYQGHMMALDVELEGLSEVSTGLDKEISPKDLAYIMYTSGTSGQPKGCQIEHGSVLNYIQWANSYYFGDSISGHFGLYSSLSFDLTVTSIFSSLSRGKSLKIYSGSASVSSVLWDSFSRESIVDVIKLTPSHINILGELDIKETNIRHVIIGGEALTIQHIDQIRKIDEGITIHNEYGPTEATVGCIVKTIGLPVGKIMIGRPIWNTEILILDDDGDDQGIGIYGEICISGAGLSRGYVNAPELTSGKFVPHPYNSGRLIYRTGDIGRWDASGEIEYLGRSDDQVKLRGYRVELGEIEYYLEQHPAVERAVVITSESPSGDQVLIAFTTGGQALNKDELSAYLSRQIPSYMIPTFYMPIRELPLTGNGKKDRVALQKLSKEVFIREESLYVGPGDQTEERLVQVWESVFGVERISITDNFFDLGGNSLKGIQLVSRIFKEFNVQIELRDIFEELTVQNISKIIKNNSCFVDYKTIEPVAEASSYILSNAQKRLWIANQLHENQIAYNLPAAYFFKGELNDIAFIKAFETLFERHESLRTIITLINGEPRQQILSFQHDIFKVIYKNLSKDPDRKEKARQLITEESQLIFELEKGPLIRAKLIQLEDNEYIFLLTMHHIISDGWSMEILFNDVLTLYKTYCEGKENPLTPLSIHYKDYAHWQHQKLNEESYQIHKQYWLKQLSGEMPILRLPTDYSRPVIKTNNGDSVVFEFTKEERDQLYKIAFDNSATLFMTILALVKILLYRYTGQTDIIVGTPVAGRDHNDLENQIGFYINILALRTQLDNNQTFNGVLENIKKTTIEAYEHQAYQFDTLVSDLNLKRDPSRSPIFDVRVELTNTIHNKVKLPDSFKISALSLEGVASHFDITFGFIEDENHLKGYFTFATDLFKKERIENMVNYFKNMVDRVIQSQDVVIDEIEFSSIDELESKERITTSLNLFDK